MFFKKFHLFKSLILLIFLTLVRDHVYFSYVTCLLPIDYEKIMAEQVAMKSL